MTEPGIGTTISHYRILEKIGQGGMGVIYKAEDTKLERTVALKFLPPDRTKDPEAKERFLKEARVASAIDHPNICNIHEIRETQEGQMYIVMAYYKGQSLKEIISPQDTLDRDEFEPLSIRKTTDIAIQVAAGLARAHQAGIIHRDIKPSNIMITEFDEAKIVDFGLAKLTTGDHLTRSDRITGTVAFMSPEQVRGKAIDFRTDIWSFGVVLYEMVTGRLPFDEEYPQATMYSIVSKDFQPPQELNDDIPLGMATIIGNCLRKDRNERYATTEALLSDLRQLRLALDSGTADSLADTIELPRTIEKPRKKRMIWAAAAIIIALCLCAVWFFTPIRDRLGRQRHFTEHHLAVLPFEVLNGDETQQAFCDGLVETLVSQISQFDVTDTSFWVVPTSEIRRNAVKSSTEAKKAFGVNLVLEGSLQYIDKTINVTLNLVDADSVRILESRNVSDHSSNLPSFQTDIVDVLAEMLGLESMTKPTEVGAQGGSLVPGANEFYLQAQGYLYQSYKNPKNLDMAIELFERAIAEDESFSRAYAGLAKTLRRKHFLEKDAKWLEQAQFHCDRAIELNARIPEPFVIAATIQSQLGEREKAIEYIGRALILDPKNTEAISRMAQVHQALGNTSNAEKMYKQAISLRKDFWLVYSRLGVFYYGQARYEDAVEQFSHVIRLTPDNPIAYQNLGGIYFYLNRWDEAREMFERSLQISPSYRVYSNLGTLYFYEGRFAEAAEAYENALSISEKDYRIWAYLGDASTWVPGKKEQATQAYKKGVELAKAALEVNPNNATILADLAEMYASLNQHADSRPLLEQVTKMPDLDLDVIFRIARIHELLGDREHALQFFSKLLETDYAMPGFEQNPSMKDIRDDIRFQRLMQKRAEKNDTH